MTTSPNPITQFKKKILKRSSSKSVDRINVSVRVRPLNQKEEAHGRAWDVSPSAETITIKNGVTSATKAHNGTQDTFNYDSIFDENVSTSEVYDSSCKAIVDNFMREGLNGTIMAYGQTGSGKTFTMQGREGEKGLLHFIAKDIFLHVGDSNLPSRDFLIRVSFIEIYNEQVRDLLENMEGCEDFIVSNSVKKSPSIGVCTEFIVTDIDSLIDVLNKGEKKRTVGRTDMNEQSSRSHSIFRITMESKVNISNGDDISVGEVFTSDLTIVDLAGSESARLTNAKGKRLKEGGCINKSLLALSRVVESLSKTNVGFVNYRDSKLTQILKPTLSGNAKVAIICCVSSSTLYTQETFSTLRFASRAKLIQTNAKKNVVMDNESLIRQLQLELSEARQALKVFEEQENKYSESDFESKTRQMHTENMSVKQSFILKGGRRRSKDHKSEISRSMPATMFNISKQTVQSWVDESEYNESEIESFEYKNNAERNDIKKERNHEPLKFNLPIVKEEKVHLFDCNSTESSISEGKNENGIHEETKQEKVDDTGQSILSVYEDGIIQQQNTEPFDLASKEQVGTSPKEESKKKVGKKIYDTIFGRIKYFPTTIYLRKISREFVIFGFGIFVGYSSKSLGVFKY